MAPALAQQTDEFEPSSSSSSSSVGSRVPSIWDAAAEPVTTALDAMSQIVRRVSTNQDVINSCIKRQSELHAASARLQSEMVENERQLASARTLRSEQAGVRSNLQSLQAQLQQMLQALDAT